MLVAAAPPSTNHPTLPVQVTFGEPADEELEVISLLGVRDPNEEWGPLGTQRPTEETYQFEVGIKVDLPDRTPAEVDARGWALRDMVREVIYDDWTLGGTVRVARNGESRTIGVQRGAKGTPVIFILHHVVVEARVVG